MTHQEADNLNQEMIALYHKLSDLQDDYPESWSLGKSVLRMEEVIHDVKMFLHGTRLEGEDD